MARGTWQTTSGGGGGTVAVVAAALVTVAVFAGVAGRGAGHAVARVADLLPWLLAGGAVVVAVATIAVVVIFRRATRPGTAGYSYRPAGSVAARPAAAGIAGQPVVAAVSGPAAGHRVAITTGQETAAGKVTTTTVLEASSEALLAQLVDIHGPAVGTGHAQRAGILPAGEDQG